MVISQAINVVVQCVQSRGGQNAGLAQTTTQNFAPAQCLGDQFTRTAQSRAHGRAQTLAETHGHAVEVVHDPAHAARYRSAFGLCHGRIEQPRAIQMHSQAMLSGQTRGLFQIVLRHDVAVPSVFQRQQASSCKVAVDGFDGCSDVTQRHFT